MRIPDVEIESTEVNASGHVEFDDSSAKVPLFCRAMAVAHPVVDSEIHFEVWLTEEGGWNVKFLGIGNFGYSGAIGNAANIVFAAAG